ncbi:CaiB/BaiF CoA transferase family protein [Chloroflexota bacterium]
MDNALEGLRVVDFSRFAAGPLGTKLLADYGADVIKIESVNYPDLPRVSSPYKDGIPGLNRSARFIHFNTSKRSMALDLNHPRASDVVRRLIAVSDVVVENFAPNVLKKFNLGYESVREIKPDIIMVSCSILGRSQDAAFRGYGTHGLALSGHYELTGWPEGEPACPATSFYADHVVPFIVVFATLSALEHKRNTGKGQYIDISQLEPMAILISPAILDYTLTGTQASRMGNRHPDAAPHSAYRCQGEDKWCTIAVFNEEQWRRLVKALGNPSWSQQEKFSSLALRKENEAELDSLIEAWTSQHTAEDIMRCLLDAQVPSGVVQNAQELFDDPQLKHREYLTALRHPEIGICAHSRPPMILSETPAQVHTSPCLGQDTADICLELLKMDPAEFTELMAEGVFN